MNIVLLDTKTLGEVTSLSKFNDFGRVSFYDYTSPDETLSRIEHAVIVITNKVVLNKEILNEAKKLKLICVSATGTNNIDLPTANKLGIVVKNAVGYSTQSVAQSTFSGLLYLMQHPAYYDDYVKSGNYSKSLIFTNLSKYFHELNGKQFGIIGLGNIGRKVAEIAEAFGCTVKYFSTSGKNTQNKYQHMNIDELLETSDIISIHAPLNENTNALIDFSRLCMMKSEAILINMGRGGIVVESDLAKALNERVIFGAVLDVLQHEPILPSSPLLNLKDPSRIFISPHNAWGSVEAREKLIDIVYSNIQQFLIDAKNKD